MMNKQPEQEPLKVLNDQFIFDKLGGIFGDPKHHKIPLTKGQIVEFGRKMFELGTRPCTTPPQRTWVGVTGDEITKCIPCSMFNGDLHATTFALEIEAILKEKNYERTI